LSAPDAFFYLHFFPVKSMLPGSADWIWLLVLSCSVPCWLFALDERPAEISAFTVNLSITWTSLRHPAAFAVFREDKNLKSGILYRMSWILLAVGLQMLRLWEGVRDARMMG